MIKSQGDIEKRLLKYIIKKPNSCWLWTGATSEGYGVIGIKGKNKQARRIYYELIKGLIHKNECLKSICKNKLCVNPHHHLNKEEILYSSIKINEKTNCWEWIKSLSNRGYGIFNYNKKMTLVHRIMYEKYKGKIPSKMFVCHSCDNPKCSNPDHLFLGNQFDNMKDMENKCRSNKSYGESHVRAILTEDIVRKIKIKFKNGLTKKQISMELNIPYHQVRYVCIGKTWKHVIIL